VDALEDRLAVLLPGGLAVRRRRRALGERVAAVAEGVLGGPRRERRDDLLAQRDGDRAVRRVEHVAALVGLGAAEPIALVEAFDAAAEAAAGAFAAGDRLDLSVDGQRAGCGLGKRHGLSFRH
jgi:hypothetical protein